MSKEDDSAKQGLSSARPRPSVPPPTSGCPRRRSGLR